MSHLVHWALNGAVGAVNLVETYLYQVGTEDPKRDFESLMYLKERVDNIVRALRGEQIVGYKWSPHFKTAEVIQNGHVPDAIPDPPNR